MSSKYEDYEYFKEVNSNVLYDYYFPHKMEQPVSCCRWGEVKYETKEFLTQEVFFGTRTDGNYN